MDDNFASNSRSKIVTFNVGGRLYDVSRSLLAEYPETMLARLASDTWSHREQRNDIDSCGNSYNNSCDNQNNNTALFIERDGERFRYCLDYMRNGGFVHIPTTISKDALLLDLDYYGFHDVDESTMSMNVSLSMLQMSSEHIDKLQHELNDRIDRKHACLLLAKHCLCRYKENCYVYDGRDSSVANTMGNRQRHLLDIRVREDEDLWSIAKELSESESNQQLLDETLQGIGLKLLWCECNYGTARFCLDYW
jgi:hypothetical protein